MERRYTAEEFAEQLKRAIQGTVAQMNSEAEDWEPGDDPNFTGFSEEEGEETGSSFIDAGAYVDNGDTTPPWAYTPAQIGEMFPDLVGLEF